MAYTFDEIMAFHPDNEVVYQEIKQYLHKLVPFIGAGLTKFSYYSWPGALGELSNKLTNVANKLKVTDCINAGNYLDAAQLLENFRTPVNLARDLAGLFSMDKLEQKRGQLPKEPISLLPLLFPNLVVTTNFDETLETVYRENGQSFQTVFLPGHPELLRQLMRQEGVRGLFKLHGTVTGGLIEYERIVFTQAQYDRHYGRCSPLPRELKDCFVNRMMLFLGCSLENDRTMELLQEVIQPGDTYYAIIGCARSDRDEKLRQLGNKHIRAILYEEPYHEAVRVILEHLLEETNPEAYHRLHIHVGALHSIDSTERFLYTAEIVPFAGREDEMRALYAFLGDAHIAFRWWAITGPGGSGKSRLAYEFQKRIPPGWVVHYMNSNDYADLSALSAKLTQKTLLIADYVQENAKTIGKWMEQLNERARSLPIRVLLVEREFNTNETGSSWVKQLYADVRHDQRLKNACYQRNFLTLRPLGDDDLLDIIGNYALAPKQNDEYTHRMLSDAIKQMLLRKLKSIDPILCRPLYALFLTDAYITGNTPEQWDRNDVLDYITMREQRRLKFNVRHTHGKSDEKLYSVCLYLYSMATVLQDMSLEELQLLCPNEWDIVQSKAECFTSPADMLEQAGLSIRGTVFALRPNLIGEYYIYTWLLQHPDQAQHFLYSVWQKPAPTAVFFDRVVHDYSYLLNEDRKYWELILPNDIPMSENTAQFYAILLVNTIYYCNKIEECKRQINLLKELAAKHHNVSDFTIKFAQGLVNLSNKQDEQQAWETVVDLERLATEHPDLPDVIICFANGLVNLSSGQAKQGVWEAVVRLEHLTAKHPDLPDIAICFAKGLFNLVRKQGEQQAWETVARLELLTDEHPDVPDIAIRLAKGLLSLSNKQNVQRARETIARLECLAAKHSDALDITVVFADGLFNLSNKQDGVGAQETIARLERLVSKHPNMPDIAVIFADGLFNLSNKQDGAGAQETIARLEHLVSKYPNVPDIAVTFANSLFNLSNKQDGAGAQETIARLKRLLAKHPDMPDIAIFFAKGLFNLSNKQDGAEAQETIARLEHLAAKYPDVLDITIRFARGLVNLSNKQDGVGAQETIARLERFADEHSDVLDITIIFAKGLFNLSIDQDEQGARETIARLERLATIYPGVPEIAIEFAKGLFNLSVDQDEQGARETIARLERLATKYPGVPEIAIEFANGLFNLSNKQDEQGARETITRLERLAAEHSNRLEIANIFAKSLFNLSNKQDERGARETIARLEHLAAKHSNRLEIANIFAKGLVNLSNKQDERGARETIARLERFAVEHPNVPDIANIFARGQEVLRYKQNEMKS